MKPVKWSVKKRLLNKDLNEQKQSELVKLLKKTDGIESVKSLRWNWAWTCGRKEGKAVQKESISTGCT